MGDLVYTKSNVDGMMAEKVGQDLVYKKQELDDKLSEKADKSSSYQKMDLDVMLTSKLQNMSVVMSGTLLFVASSLCPVGYLLADGSLVSRQTYDELFRAISVVYGHGDGVTTFALPDLVTANRYVRAGGGGMAVGAIQNATTAVNGLHATSVSAVFPNPHDHVYTSSSGQGAAQLIVNDATKFGYQDGTADSSSTRLTVSTSTSLLGDAETRPVSIALLPCLKA